MKVKDGFISNSSTTYFVLNDSTRDISNLQNRWDLFIQCGMICGFVDSIWDNIIRDTGFYLENGVLMLSGPSIPEDIAKLIRAIFDVKEEYTQ